MRRIPLFLTIFFATLGLLSSAPTTAQPAGDGCMVGPGMAASLLFPYFEVDLDDPLGRTTLVSINNGFTDPALARVVLWTDWGMPSMAFDIYLEGFDVQTINLRTLFAGEVPSTGEEANLAEFEFCDRTSAQPFHENPVLGEEQRAQLRADHTGTAGPLFENCFGAAHGDGIARGYVTVDAVDECSGVEASNRTGPFDMPVRPTFTPEDPVEVGYFDDGDPKGNPIATNENRLWGDLLFIDPANAAAQGGEAVAIWADPNRFAPGDSGVFTFYGRFHDWDGRDRRVPLPSAWKQRFLNGGEFAGGADYVVWRDPAEVVEPATCGTVPPAFPLADTIFVLDEAANGPLELGDGSTFELATQRLDVDTLQIPYQFGWMQIDTEADDVPGQAWVSPVFTASGLYSVGLNGAPFAFLCDRTPPAPTL